MPVDRRAPPVYTAHPSVHCVDKIAISTFLQKALLVPMVALWAFHLYQRKSGGRGTRKRIATLSLTMVLIGGWIASWLFSRYGVADEWLILVAALAVAVVAWQRRLMLPFRRACAQCGKPVPFARMFVVDSNKCEACEPPSTEGETTR